jgi:hypothetical protein
MSAGAGDQRFMSTALSAGEGRSRNISRSRCPPFWHTFRSVAAPARPARPPGSGVPHSARRECSCTATTCRNIAEPPLRALPLAFATARSLALLAVATWYGDQRCASAATAGDRCFAPVDHRPRQPPPAPPPRRVAGVMPGVATCVFVLAPDRLKKRRRRAAGV